MLKKHEILYGDNCFILLRLEVISNQHLPLNTKRPLVKISVALLLLVAFMLPVTMQLFHSLEGHGHEICKSKNTHLHQASQNCAVCDFHYVPFQYAIADFFPSESLVIPSQHQVYFVPRQFNSLISSNTRLRGPPQILI